ncbi:fucolectin-1-like [Sinocyclocheilus anshuiensis]|uniref:fucolectin-1-like n=1 Tax=Sinocyclocheilus anshuiensis TaxID=1608454 RepID=UPI0007B96183|nr:PREDICTED: fucolectin-1-like [Sinocyclocheilus anshuiensis]
MNMRTFYKSLLLLLGFFSVQAKAGTEVNVARWGTAAQSTLFYDWYTQNALDGLSSTCSHTTTHTDPWWKLDLMKMYSVNRVTITNRPDCCESRINGAEIRVGSVSSDVFSNPVSEQIDGAEIRIGNSLENNGNNNPICAVISSIPAGFSSTYTCNNMDGRYVSLFIPGDSRILTLCEVEVYGKGPVLKKTFVKMNLKSSSSLSEPGMRVQLLSQLQPALVERGFSDVMLQWSQPPEKEVMRKEAVPSECAQINTGKLKRNLNVL